MDSENRGRETICSDTNVAPDVNAAVEFPHGCARTRDRDDREEFSCPIERDRIPEQRIAVLSGSSKVHLQIDLPSSFRETITKEARRLDQEQIPADNFGEVEMQIDSQVTIEKNVNLGLKEYRSELYDGKKFSDKIQNIHVGVRHTGGEPQMKDAKIYSKETLKENVGIHVNERTNSFEEFEERGNIDARGAAADLGQPLSETEKDAQVEAAAQVVLYQENFHIYDEQEVLLQIQQTRNTKLVFFPEPSAVVGEDRESRHGLQEKKSFVEEIADKKEQPYFDVDNKCHVDSGASTVLSEETKIPKEIQVTNYDEGRTDGRIDFTTLAESGMQNLETKTETIDTEENPTKDDDDDNEDYHKMKGNEMPKPPATLTTTGSCALDSEEITRKESAQLMHVETQGAAERGNHIEDTAYMTLDADPINGLETRHSARSLAQTAATHKTLETQNPITAEETSVLNTNKKEPGSSSGHHIRMGIMMQVNSVSNITEPVSGTFGTGSFESHNMALMETRVREQECTDEFSDAPANLKSGTTNIVEENMRISNEGNLETFDEENYVTGKLEKEEMTQTIIGKRKISENESSRIVTGQIQGETTVKKAKKKSVNVWAKSSTRKGGKRNSKNGSQQNLAKEDAVFLAPVHVNQEKLEDGPDQPISLSKHDKAEKIELSENRLSASSSKGYRMVRATRGVQEGTWYFEITVEQLGPTGHTRLGWSTQKGDVQAPVGFDSNSYGYRDVDGSKLHVAIREPYGDPYIEGDVIGFYIHLPNGAEYSPLSTSLVSHRGRPYLSEAKEELPKKVPGSQICFFRNGVCQGTAFKDINGGRYFPAASMYTMPKEPNCTVKFNFGPEFQYPPLDLGSRPAPTAMFFAPYYNVLGGKEMQLTIVNNSSTVNITQGRNLSELGR